MFVKLFEVVFLLLMWSRFCFFSSFLSACFGFRGCFGCCSLYTSFKLCTCVLGFLRLWSFVSNCFMFVGFLHL